MTDPNSQLVCESEVEYFPFGIPFVTFTGMVSTGLAKVFPSVTCINQISSDLLELIATFLPFNFLLQFLKLPCEPRLAETGEDLKQLIRFWLPKRTAIAVKTFSDPPEVESYLSFSKSTPDIWMAIAESLDLKYTVNEIPENVNWFSLGIVIVDLQTHYPGLLRATDDFAVQRVVSFLRNKIPSKYLSDGLTYVVQLLWITRLDRSCENWNAEILKLEFYEINGLKHCDWYLFKSQENPSLHLCVDFVRNSTIVYLKRTTSNDDWDTGEIVTNDLATYLLTAKLLYPFSCGGYQSNHSKNLELLLDEIPMGKPLPQLWKQITNLFQISNFSFINHQDQTTPVNIPTDLVVLTDYTFGEDPRDTLQNITFLISDYLTDVRNSAVATAYRNNSCCLRTLQSFKVNVIVLRFGRFYFNSPRAVVSRHQLEMSRDHMCEIKVLDCDYIRGVSTRDLESRALFDGFAFLRHRPLQVECWDREHGEAYPLLSNPFGFISRRHEFHYEYALSGGRDDSSD